MEHENKGIIEAFRGGRRRPRLFVGAGPFTSPECRPDRASDFGNDGLSSLKGLYFLAFDIVQSIVYLVIECLYPLYLKAIFSNVCLSCKINLILYNGRRAPVWTGSESGPSDGHVFYNLK